MVVKTNVVAVNVSKIVTMLGDAFNYKFINKVSIIFVTDKGDVCYDKGK